MSFSVKKIAAIAFKSVMQVNFFWRGVGLQEITFIQQECIILIIYILN